MGRLKKFTDKLFGSKKKAVGNGLYASLDELMNMRRYAGYIQNSSQLKSYSMHAGDIKSAFRGRGIEMEEIREYGFGDDVRDIDWRVTARKETPYTKIYAEERDYEIFVWLDISPIMMFGSKNELKSVTASKFAALLGWVSLNNKDKFGCIIFDGKQSWLFSPKKDRMYLAAILKKISEVSKMSLQNIEEIKGERKKSLKVLQAHLKGRGSVFLLSSFVGWSEDFDKELAAISKKNRLFVVDVFDKLEETAPVSGQYMAEYDGDKIIFDSSSKNYRREYKKYFDQKRLQKEGLCRKIGCRIIRFNSEMSYVDGVKIL